MPKDVYGPIILMITVTGANNDINVLDNSPLFDDLLDDLAPVVPYVVNGVEYRNGYYLADGIYSEWANFVKSFTVATDPKHTYFKQRQESARKDVERAFDVLQGRWRLIQQPARTYEVNTLRRIMYAGIIMHNMILEDQNMSIVGMNHVYSSPARIQKDIVECFKKETVNCICLEIGDDVLSLLVDESSDVVKKEQMVVVLRYVDKFGILKERFIGIIHMGNISSSTLKVAIDYLFNKHNLNLQQTTSSEKRSKYLQSRFIGKRNKKSMEFGDCFSEGSNNLLDCMLVLSQHDSFSEFNVSKLVNLNEMYPRDFTYKERLCLHMELGVYYQIMRSDKDFDKLDGIVKLAEKMVDKKKHTSHPLVYRLFKLALDLPLATTTVERCFSKMKLIET
nr:protein ALP1-like [Tanacetum cinerariifolium]